MSTAGSRRAAVRVTGRAVEAVRGTRLLTRDRDIVAPSVRPGGPTVRASQRGSGGRVTPESQQSPLPE
ncbi:hypothetical protein GCM10009543_06690 [Leifsonia naganoensis]